jgi:hypothetical protein
MSLSVGDPRRALWVSGRGIQWQPGVLAAVFTSASGCRGGRSSYVSVFKLRVWLLGLLAVVLLGAFSAPALAVGGPYCWHRNNAKEEKGFKITEAEPEEIAGSGGSQRLEGTIGGTAVVLESSQVQVKGIIYNNPDQCQAKVSLTYNEPKLVGFEKTCEFKINGNNVVKLFGHQAWKWNGTKAQLEEKSQALQHRDWIFLPVELQQGATSLPTGTPLATITIASKPGFTCLLTVAQRPVEGSATAEGFANPQISKEDQKLGTWGRVEELRFLGGEGAQHFWNGTKFIGAQTGLTFGGPAAGYKGRLEINPIGKQGKTPPQEIAYFEE